MIVFTIVLMFISFMVGAAFSVWGLRRYWQHIQSKEKFLDTRDKQLTESERRQHDANERHAGILGIEGTVVVISHDVMVYQGSVPLLTHGGEMYEYAGPARRQHRLVLEEIIPPAPMMEEDPAELEPTEEELDDWDPDDYYEETDGDDD